MAEGHDVRQDGPEGMSVSEQSSPIRHNNQAPGRAFFYGRGEEPTFPATAGGGSVAEGHDVRQDGPEGMSEANNLSHPP